MGKTYCLSESFSIKGYFGIPNTKNKVGGTMSFIPGEYISLDLIGGISEIFPSIVNCIWGELENGQVVSLFNCTSSSSVNSKSNFYLQKFSCSLLLFGKQIIDLKEPLFFRCLIQIYPLTFWCKPEVYETKISYLENQKNKLQIIESKLISSNFNRTIIETKLDNEVLLSIKGTGSFECDLYTHSTTFSEYSYIELKSETAISLDEFYRKVLKIEQFMSLVTLTPELCTSFILYDEKDQISSIIYKQVHFNDDLKNKRIPNFLIEFDGIKDKFQSILNLLLDEHLSPILSHLLDSITYRPYFSENDFLILVQALDGYSKRFVRNKGNLGNRLNCLYEEFHTLKIFENVDFNGDSIANTRNYYSHLYDESEIKGVWCKDAESLYAASKELRKLLICCILKFIGYSTNEINNICSQSSNHILR